MKTVFSLLFLTVPLIGIAQINVGGTINDKANQKTGEAIDAVFNSAKKKDKSSQEQKKEQSSTSSSSTTSSKVQQNESSFKAYQNYDFVPGDQILFEDHFTDDQLGEFPAHWKLEQGQAVVNTVDDERAFFITAYYSIFSPRMKTPNYLPTQYTLEFDTWHDLKYDGNEGVYVEFRNNNEKVATLNTCNSYYAGDFPGGKLRGDLPASIANDNYFDRWHHVAIAVNGKQIKVYCDQYRVLVIPDCNFQATSIAIGGNASEGLNMMFKNVRLASGGSMNMVGKKFTDTKIVTHGINFDYNKATIRPESMGTLNMIVQVMKDNPDLKFEVGGYTDSDGDDAYNLKLSQQRADAVREQLIKMGIDGNRLTAKGYGESKPIGDNTTLEGKGQNRRVEFVKL